MLEDLSYIDVKDLLISTGCKNVAESAGEVSFSCPGDTHFHGDNNPSARMNSYTTAWICHGCKERGNAITFLAWHKKLPETVARRLLEERYRGGAMNAPIGGLEVMVKEIQNPVVIEEPERKLPDESWLEKFRVDWKELYRRLANDFKTYHDYAEYIFQRGFDQHVLNNWEIGYDEISDRITIPIKDHMGRLVGFKGRSYKHGYNPRYMILGGKHYGFDPYLKSHYVFGLEPLYRSAKDKCIIVEGELNVLAMDQYGYNAVGIAGSEFSPIQRGLITSNFREVTLYLDNDKAGESGTKKVIEMLSPYMPIKVVQNAPGDAAELDKDTVKELISSAEPALLLQAQGKL